MVFLAANEEGGGPCFGGHVVGGCLALLMCLPVWAGQTAVPMAPSAWEQKVFLEPGSSILETQAATFSFTSDEKLGLN